MAKITYVLGRPAAKTQNTAAGQVQQVLGPQLQQQAAYGQHQNAVIQSFARSLLGKLQPVAGQVGADYDSAIKQIGGLSGQAAQYLSGQNPTASQQALTSAVGAPASQQAQQARQLSDTFQGGAGVLAFTGGAIPGAQLAGNKAAAQAQARTLPAIAALKGQQDLSSALWQQTQDRNKIEAQRPELEQQAQQQIDETRIANQKLAQAEQAARATAAYRSAQINLGYDKLNQSAVDKAAARAETAAYHDAYLTHLQTGDSERVAHNKALEAAATERLRISQQQADTSAYSAQTGRINAATSRQNAITSANKPEDRSIPGGGIVRVYPDGTTKVLRKPSPTATASNVQTKTINGVTWERGPKPDGTIGWVKVGLPTAKPKPPKPSTLSGGELQRYTSDISDTATGLRSGVPKTKNASGDDIPGQPAASLADALAFMEAHGYMATPQLRKLTLRALHRLYPPYEWKIVTGGAAGPAIPSATTPPKG